MFVETTYLGKVEVQADDILTFANGIPGFKDEKEYVLLPFGKEGFFLLQSAVTKHHAFICVNPFIFWANYEIRLDDQSIEQLNLSNETDVALFVLLTIEQPFTLSTANLKAPIVTNTKNGKAKQLMLQTSHYSAKTPLVTKGGS